MSLSAEARLRDEAVRVFQAGEAGAIGLAVSGGSDSMAMLWLVAPWAQAQGRPVAVATVDHGLRAEAVEEAAFVARICAGMGVPHEVLRWEGWDKRGNLQARAREARHALLSGWARARGIGTVALGHTMDDQAETVLLRLARGSGVDGLAGMAGVRAQGGLRWVRPLLALRREALRDFLRESGRDWRDDPSNAAERFDRVKARRALAALAPLGLDAEGLSATARRMAMARAALEQVAREAAAAVARIEGGDVVLARPGFDLLPDETRLRLLSDAVRWVGGSVYRPRLAALEAALAAGGRRTLQGTVLTRTAADWRVGREWAAVRGMRAELGEVWDGRWRVEGPEVPGAELRALGEAGLAACPGWRATGLGRATLATTPAVWRGDVLVAAPVADYGRDWSARIVAPFRD
jgi:tRNA(Ile)-lysidine synthase